jgi:hypothetical protein
MCDKCLKWRRMPDDVDPDSLKDEEVSLNHIPKYVTKY